MRETLRPTEYLKWQLIFRDQNIASDAPDSAPRNAVTRADGNETLPKAMPTADESAYTTFLDLNFEYTAEHPAALIAHDFSFQVTARHHSEGTRARYRPKV
jgi:hypothetical protein